MKIETSNVVVLGGVTLFTVLIYLLWKRRSVPTKNVFVTLKHPEIKYSLSLASKENVTHDTRRFRFALPSSRHVLGLPVGQHIYLAARINGELVKRPYTPVTAAEQQGYFDLVIKIYPNGNFDLSFSFSSRKDRWFLGKMGEYLDHLPLGHTVEISGPAGSLTYKGQGRFAIRSRPGDASLVRHLGLIAGGTGITPMYQLLTALLHEDGRRTELTIDLLFANQSEEDILLREEIESLSANSAGRFRVWFTIDRANEHWKYSRGFVSESLIKEHLPPPSDDVLICICGPPPMIKLACLPLLRQLAYSDTMLYTF